MTGLDKILDQIRKESDAAVSRKLGEANTQAETIRKKAAAEADEECARIEASGKQKADDTLARATSAAALLKRKTILAEKQRIIADTFDKAEKALCNLSDSEYFDMITKIAVKNALPQEGLIIFSEKDKKRCPVTFEVKLNSLLEGGKLTVSDGTVETEGGFVLSYGGIEENCTFSALIDSARETLADKVQEILF